MIESNDAPPPVPRAPWIVRAIGPRPASTFGEKLREVVRRTAWMMLFEATLSIAMHVLGVNIGNVGVEKIEELLNERTVYFFFLGVLIGPVVEELAFRGVPSWVSNAVLRRKDGQRWVLGVITSVAFMMLHNVAHEAGEGRMALIGGFYLDTSMLPLPQFLLGLLLWDLARRYGLWASICSHMLNNFVFISLAIAGKSAS